LAGSKRPAQDMCQKTEMYLSFKNKLKEVGVNQTVDQIKKKISNFKEGML
jgi:hypothetical protein